MWGRWPKSSRLLLIFPPFFHGFAENGVLRAPPGVPAGPGAGHVPLEQRQAQPFVVVPPNPAGIWELSRSPPLLPAPLSHRGSSGEFGRRGKLRRGIFHAQNKNLPAEPPSLNSHGRNICREFPANPRQALGCRSTARICRRLLKAAAAFPASPAASPGSGSRCPSSDPRSPALLLPATSGHPQL